MQPSTARRQRRRRMSPPSPSTSPPAASCRSRAAIAQLVAAGLAVAPRPGDRCRRLPALRPLAPAPSPGRTHARALAADRRHARVCTTASTPPIFARAMRGARGLAPWCCPARLWQPLCDAGSDRRLGHDGHRALARAGAAGRCAGVATAARATGRCRLPSRGRVGSRGPDAGGRATRPSAVPPLAPASSPSAAIASAGGARSRDRRASTRTRPARSARRPARSNALSAPPPIPTASAAALEARGANPLVCGAFAARRATRALVRQPLTGRINSAAPKVAAVHRRVARPHVAARSDHRGRRKAGGRTRSRRSAPPAPFRSSRRIGPTHRPPSSRSSRPPSSSPSRTAPPGEFSRACSACRSRPRTGRSCRSSRGLPATRMRRLPIALPADAALPLERLIARLSSALRVRALHATVLRRIDLFAAQGGKLPALPAGDALDDATVLIAGRGPLYPALSVAIGERVNLVGAFSVEAAAKHLAARDIDGVVVGDGFSPHRGRSLPHRARAGGPLARHPGRGYRRGAARFRRQPGHHRSRRVATRSASYRACCRWCACTPSRRGSSA